MIFIQRTQTAALLELEDGDTVWVRFIDMSPEMEAACLDADLGDPIEMEME